MRLAGVVIGGYYLARSAKVAQQLLDSEQGDAIFNDKISIARFMLNKLCPSVRLVPAITQGAEQTLRDTKRTAVMGADLQCFETISSFRRRLVAFSGEQIGGVDGSRYSGHNPLDALPQCHRASRTASSKIVRG